MSESKATTFLVTDENPQGWRIEDILSVIRDDLIKRTQKIVGDNRPEARAVLKNNIAILSAMTQCIELAEDSTQLLNKAFGPHQDGQPRIGVM